MVRQIRIRGEVGERRRLLNPASELIDQAELISIVTDVRFSPELQAYELKRRPIQAIPLGPETDWVDC